MRRLDRLDESLQLARRAVALSESAPESALALKAKAELATTLRDQGEHGEAKDLFETALALQKKLLGEESADTINTMRELARLLSITGDNVRAAELMDEIARVGKKFRPRHPTTLAAVDALSKEYARLGRYDDAAETLEDMLEMLALDADDARSLNLRTEIKRLHGLARGVNAVEASGGPGSSSKPRGGT